jgi:hypothetical protein
VHDHLASIVGAAQSPSPLVEKAVLDLLRVCQRLLPYKEDLGDELLKSLQLVLRLDARVADAYAERITQEMLQLVKSSVTYIRWAIVVWCCEYVVWTFSGLRICELWLIGRLVWLIRSTGEMLQLVKNSVTYIRWAIVVWGSKFVVWTFLGLNF